MTHISSQLGPDKVVYHDLTGVISITKDIVEQLRIRREKLAAKEDKHYVINVLEGVLEADFEAQEYLSHEVFTNKLGACAFVGSGFLFEHLTSMFLRYHRPDYPTQRFYCIEDAQAWIYKHQKGLSSDDKKDEASLLS